MNEIATRLIPTFKVTHSMPEIAVARLFWISYIKPMPNPTKATRQRLVMASRSWRNFYTPCSWKRATQYSTSAAACAVPTNGKTFGMTCYMARISYRKLQIYSNMNTP